MPITLTSGPAELSYSRNPVQIKLQPETPDNYVVLDIYDGDNNKAVSLRGDPDSNGFVYFEISSILDTIVEFETPEIGSGVVKKTKIISKYHCIANEMDSGNNNVSTVNIGWDGATASLWAIKGGLSVEASGQDVFTWLKDNRKFLTWYEKYFVQKSQHVFLYYLSQFAEDINIDIVVTYSDGSLDKRDITTIPVEKYDLFSINAGFNFNGLGTAGKIPVKYTIRVFLSGTDTLRAIIELNFLDDDYFKPVIILNPNSLGGFDSHVFTGDGTMNNQADKSIATGDYNYNMKDYAFGNTLQKGFEVATGHLSKTELDLLSDLLANNGYIVINSKLIPIISDKSNQLKTEIRGGLNGVVLKFTRANHNINFTPDGFLS